MKLNPTPKSLISQKLMLFGNVKKKSNCSVKITQKKIEGLDKYTAFVFTVCQESQCLAPHASTQIRTYMPENSPHGIVPLACFGRYL